MNIRFIAYIITTSIIWSVLIAGLLINIEYFYNISLAFLWFVSISGILIGLLSLSDSVMEKINSERNNRKTELHKAISWTSKILMCCLIAATGHFVLFAFFVIGIISSRFYEVRLNQE